MGGEFFLLISLIVNGMKTDVALVCVRDYFVESVFSYGDFTKGDLGRVGVRDVMNLSEVEFSDEKSGIRSYGAVVGYNGDEGFVEAVEYKFKNGGYFVARVGSDDEKANKLVSVCRGYNNETKKIFSGDREYVEKVKSDNKKREKE